MRPISEFLRLHWRPSVENVSDGPSPQSRRCALVSVVGIAGLLFLRGFMGLRTRHGNATNYGISPVLETLPADELPAGLPAPTRNESPGDRGENGRFGPANSLARRGGEAKAQRVKLAKTLRLADIPQGSQAKKYYDAATEWLQATTATMASHVGAGYCGLLPSAQLKNAALALAWSQYFFDQAAQCADEPSKAAKFVEQGQKLAEASSRLSREAWEYCAREAAVQKSKIDPYALLDDE